MSYGLGFSFNPATKLGFLTNIGESEEYAIGMQLLQLAFKQERKFDWKSLITAALTAEANDAIAHIPGFQQNPGGTFFHPAPPNLRNTFASTFTDDFINSEVETRHFNAEDAAAQALGTVAGLGLAQQARNAYNDYKNKQEQKLLQSYYADQDFQKTRQRMNAIDAELESFGEAQDADFKAMLNTNPFTGEPLNATDPMDPSQQSDDKTPSYQQRQDAHEQSQSKAANWNAQVNQNTFGSRSSGGFLQGIENVLAEMQASAEGEVNAFGGHGSLANANNLSPQEQINFSQGYHTGLAEEFTSDVAQLLLLSEGIVTGSASLASKFGFFGRAPILDSKDYVDLYRAVKPTELQQILETGKFENPFGFEEKYFSTSLEGARQYAKMAEEAFGDPPYSFVKTTIPNSVVTDEMRANVDRGINSLVVFTEDLPKLSDPEVLEYLLIDRSDLYVSS